LNGYDPGDYDQAKNIWWHCKNNKTKGGKPHNDRDIYKLIAKAAEKGMWEKGGKLSTPSETQVRTWIKKYWEPMARVLPKDEIVLPWSEASGPEPARIRTLSVLFDLASEIWQTERIDHPDMGLNFPGFPKLVCDWAWKLSAFFDLTLQRECVVLLHFAYVFAADERYKKAFEEPMSIREENSKMLMRWHKRHQEPELTQKIFDYEGSVSIPIWEQPNEESMAWAVASHLKGEPWVLLAIDEGEVQKPGNGSDTEGPSSRGSEEILAGFLAQGYEIDDSHAGLDIVYTNREEEETE